ncbi:MAG: GTPase [Pseudomonadota bacterium]
MSEGTLVFGGSARAREAAIAARLSPGHAVIVEGLADPHGALAACAAALSPAPTIARIAPGCLCCTGNLVLRVTLQRLLRQRPPRLFIALASSEHLAQLRLWLSSAPFDAWLRLDAQEIDLGSTPPHPQMQGQDRPL